MQGAGVYRSEVNENYPDFDYNLLAEPPPGWELYNIPDQTHLRNRTLDLETFKNLVTHHSWGIRCVIEGRKTKEKLLQVLKRIIFNYQAHLRPSWHDFVGRTCDSGPRFLRPVYNALQISRSFPNGIPGVQLQQSANPTTLSRPLPNQQSYHHTVQVQNNSFALSDPSSLPVTAPIAIPPPEPVPQSAHTVPASQNLGLDTVYSGTAGSSMSQSMQSGYISQIQNSADFTKQPVGPSVEVSAQQQENNGPLIRSALDFGRPDAGESREAQSVIEAIERVLVNFAYKSLERHPLAFPIVAYPPHITATSAVSGQLPTFKFDPTGTRYPYRGRGPVLGDNSAALDCIVVVGKLLDAGSTVADRGGNPNWIRGLTKIEYAYLEAVNINWDVLSDRENADIRDIFLEIVLKQCGNTKRPGAAGQTRVGMSLALVEVWAACTKSFRQFQFSYSDTSFPCVCQGLQPFSTVPQSASSIILGIREDDRHIESLIGRFFEHEQTVDCPHCRAREITLTRKFDTLPLRLVVQPDAAVSHTSTDIKFEYRDVQGLKHNVAYRWLGGIYNVPVGQSHSFKVFWNDHERGEIDTGTLRIYDSMQISGVVVGNILPPNSEERVPKSWWTGGSSPLLFYEKVINPSMETLVTAQQAVEHMLAIASNDRLIMVDHQPWKPFETKPNGIPLQQRYLISRPPRGRDSAVAESEIPTAKRWRLGRPGSPESELSSQMISSEERTQEGPIQIAPRNRLSNPAPRIQHSGIPVTKEFPKSRQPSMSVKSHRTHEPLARSQPSENQHSVPKLQPITPSYPGPVSQPPPVQQANQLWQLEPSTLEKSQQSSPLQDLEPSLQTLRPQFEPQVPNLMAYKPKGRPLINGASEQRTDGLIDTLLSEAGPHPSLPRLPRFTRYPDASQLDASSDLGALSSLCDPRCPPETPPDQGTVPAISFDTGRSQQLEATERNWQTLPQDQSEQLELEQNEFFSTYLNGIGLQDIPISQLTPLELSQPDQLPWVSQFEELMQPQQLPHPEQIYAHIWDEEALNRSSPQSTQIGQSGHRPPIGPPTAIYSPPLSQDPIAAQDLSPTAHNIILQSSRDGLSLAQNMPHCDTPRAEHCDLEPALQEFVNLSSVQDTAQIEKEKMQLLPHAQHQTCDLDGCCGKAAAAGEPSDRLMKRKPGQRNDAGDDRVDNQRKKRKV